MYPPTLTAKSRALWETLAGVPTEFRPVLRVVVSPYSRLCPLGWVGIVVIADSVIATAPTPAAADAVQQALGTLPAALLTNPETLSTQLQLLEVRGPACLAYLDPVEFQPYQGAAAVEQLLPHDEDLRQLAAVSGAEDVEESGITEITSPAFAAREHGTIFSAAGYRVWPGAVAHLSVLTMSAARGRALPAPSHQPRLRTRSGTPCSLSGEPGHRHPTHRLRSRLPRTWFPGEHPHRTSVTPGSLAHGRSIRPMLRGNAAAMAAFVVLTGCLPGYVQPGGNLRPPDAQGDCLLD